MTESDKSWRIAVVEDDDGLRAAILRMLAACGWEGSGFPAAEDFLGSEARHQADCMVLDLYLPGISGFALLEKIRKQDIQTPAILITAQDDARIGKRVEQAGASYLQKPFSGDLLAATIRMCMHAQRK
ncbi:response regulator [Oxalicibacterium solurbis]|uniref:Response regulator n=2 Tax=Oxalicibacterium solurbis TaxID=69280 RepID=A0A8J3AWI4_9BURK|nr:response regulator [Oxalicibacterium solurbis]